MKIEGNGLSAELLRLLHGEAPARRGRRGQVVSPEVDGVSVELSEVSLTPEEVDREKVERIKEAIRNGSYRPEPHRIAEGLLKEIFGDDL